MRPWAACGFAEWLPQHRTSPPRGIRHLPRYRLLALPDRLHPQQRARLLLQVHIMVSRTQRRTLRQHHLMAPLVDPRLGDIEDDASSTKRRSLLAIAGSLLAEISIPKLVAAWLLLIALPGVLLGLAPLIASGWLAALSRKVTAPLSGIWPLLLLVLVVALGWIGGGPCSARQSRASGLSIRSPFNRATRSAARACGTSRSISWRRARRWGQRTLRAASAAGAGIIVRDRSAGRGARVAGLALDRRGRRPGLASPAPRPGVGQRRRARERVPGGGRARLGDRRRDDGSAPRPAVL